MITRRALAVFASLAMLLALASTALAASPSPGTGGDPRSAGEGPGLVGDPAFAVIAVIGIGLLAVVGTLSFIAMTGGRRR